MDDGLSNTESYCLGVVIGLTSLLQVVFVVVLVAAVFGAPLDLPVEAFLLVAIVLSGLYVAVELIARYAASAYVSKETARVWNDRIKALGPVALFVLWWKYLRPRRAG